MKFSPIAISFGFAALVAAIPQATTTASTTAAQSSEAACLAACAATDVDCRAHCLGNPVYEVPPSLHQLQIKESIANYNIDIQ